nr:EAL domain-containing protein [Vibrio sp. 03_296]
MLTNHHLKCRLASIVCPSLLQGHNFSALYRELSSLDCRLLTIEITENASMYYTAEIYQNVAKLKQLDCKISIDDFGTGNNNVALISKINPDYLKIDREFVIGVKSDARKLKDTKTTKFDHGQNLPLHCDC